MRFIEVIGSPQQHINNEETCLVEKIQQRNPIPKKSLSEREHEIARLLTTRGILKRFKIDDELYYKLNSIY